MFRQQLLSHTHPDRSDSAYGSPARQYRSKRQRPCDLCRQRKTQCKLPGSGGACELCDKRGRSCTFALQPLRKRQRRSPEIQSTPVQHRATQPDVDDYTGDPLAFDVGAFQNSSFHFEIGFDSQTPPVSGSQGGAIDWSYLNFPICKNIAPSSNVHEYQFCHPSSFRQ